MLTNVFLAAQGGSTEAADSLFNVLGMDFFENEIDEVIFRTNEFLTDADFIGGGGPFWWILEMCMALGALFSIIIGAGMAYKMMIKGEMFDVLKILRVLGISMVMMFWYPHSSGEASVLGMLAYIPNCIGSYCKAMYTVELEEVNQRWKELPPLIQQRDTLAASVIASKKADSKNLQNASTSEGTVQLTDGQTVQIISRKAETQDFFGTYAGVSMAVDKFVMILAMVFFKIGWWGTIFCQQLLLGMLTIFGPIQWAFSLLPKWEGAWAKWITRYLTVHFYGAMLYFVGFYVLLLFDIVFSIQVESLTEILEQSGGSTPKLSFYIQNAFLTAGYLLVASIVSLKCLNLVPDLAAWMIPEGDTAFSTRNFGEGVASQAKASATSMLRG